MKRTVFVCSVILAMAIAVTAAAPGDQQGKTVPRDISGAMSGMFAFTGPWEGPWIVEGNASGTVTHLGLAQMHTTHTTSADGIVSGGTFEIIAANGDRIRGSYSASGTWVGEFEVKGTASFFIEEGTGRFKGASGTIGADFFETLASDYWSAEVEWLLDGTIAY